MREIGHLEHAGNSWMCSGQDEERVNERKSNVQIGK